MDCQMPVMDGYTATIKITKPSLEPHSRDSCHCSWQGEEKGALLAIGMNTLNKPVSLERIKAVIANTARKKKY